MWTRKVRRSICSVSSLQTIYPLGILIHAVHSPWKEFYLESTWLTTKVKDLFYSWSNIRLFGGQNHIWKHNFSKVLLDRDQPSTGPVTHNSVKPNNLEPQNFYMISCLNGSMDFKTGTIIIWIYEPGQAILSTQL